MPPFRQLESKSHPHTGGGPPTVMSLGSYTHALAWVWGTGASLGSFVAPTAGGPIDGVSFAVVGVGSTAYLAVPGWPMLIESGGAFSAGADLEVLGDGRVVQRTTGKIVMRALEAAAGAGITTWASCRYY